MKIISITFIFWDRRISVIVDFEKNAENAPLLAIVAVHTAEDEPLKVWG